jgi:UDP-GlcNAc:undecaprenyl-phosphate/decaprenyl-phosphate GlcNAc-1-phosphate transferase
MNLLFSPLLFSVFCFAVFLALEKFYFRLADRYNVIDKPNERSSHTVPVIRGGGIIFALAILIGEASAGLAHPFFICGALLIAVISFADDIQPQPVKLRFLCHLVAILLVLYEADLLERELVFVLVVTVVGVGAVNAFNFMDGINGITGIYALVNLGTFLVINRFKVPFVSEHLLLAVIAAVVVFLIFNYRSKARCFAGDVGSVTLAYIQIFLVLLLIAVTKNFAWVLMFTVYGIETMITIILRLWKRENIFKPHRNHLYQYLVNQLGLPHKLVSLIYGLIQLCINTSLFLLIPELEFALLGVIIVSMVALYIYCRCRVNLSVMNKKLER